MPSSGRGVAVGAGGVSVGRVSVDGSVGGAEVRGALSGGDEQAARKREKVRSK
jgi:hypothetical protein